MLGIFGISLRQSLNKILSFLPLCLAAGDPQQSKKVPKITDHKNSINRLALSYILTIGLLIQDSAGSAETDDLRHLQMKTRLGNKQLSSEENESSYTASCLAVLHISQKISRIKFVCITPEVYVPRG